MTETCADYIKEALRKKAEYTQKIAEKTFKKD